MFRPPAVRVDPTRFEGVAFDDGRQTVRVVNGGKESYVYNLGNVYFVDKVLFTETSDVLRVMEKSDDRGQIQYVFRGEWPYRRAATMIIASRVRYDL